MSTYDIDTKKQVKSKKIVAEVKFLSIAGKPQTAKHTETEPTHTAGLS